MDLNANRKDLGATNGETLRVVYFARYKSDGHSHPRIVCTFQN